MKRSIVLLAILTAISLLFFRCSSTAAVAAETTTAPETTAATGTATTADTSDSASTTSNSTTGSAADGTLELTLEELKQYDGQNGNPAYIAVDGIIYDVTNVREWKNAQHNGYTAGNDLTDAIKNVSPHGVSKLNGVPVVGILVDG